MKIRSNRFIVTTVGCVLVICQTPRAMAVVSDEDFKKLADLVEHLNEKVDAMSQTHEQDQQTIKKLEQQVGRSNRNAGEARQKTDDAKQQIPQAAAPAAPAVDLASAATHNVVMAGDAEVQFGRMPGQHAGFTMADFAPIFLYRANDNILFEAGFDINLQNNQTVRTNGMSLYSGSSTSVNLSFAQLDYLLNDYVTIVAGNMILPLGTYQERGAGWLNKIPDDPMARSLLPGTGTGVQLRGAVPVGESGSLFSYSVYGVNGPSSVDGSANSTYLDDGGHVQPNLDLGGNVGTNGNLHSHPSYGGRVAYFMPFSAHHDFEIGLSGQTGEWDNGGNRKWSAAVLDAAVHLSSNFEMKGEYISSWVDTNDIGTFKPSGWWVQAGYKLAGLDLDLPLISNFELVSRYDTMKDGLGTTTNRMTAGMVYYFTNTLQLEGDYEWFQSRGPNATPGSGYILQMSYGF